jgi:hypothetical protein
MSPAGKNNDRQRRRRRIGCSKTQFENDMAPILASLVEDAGNLALDRVPQQHQLGLLDMNSL